jgi:Skp family chaperone for outer membrane proteins
MFISNQEKKSIDDKFKEYGETIAKLSIDIVVLTAKIKAMESNPKAAKPKKAKKPMTAAQKAKQREYQRAYNERKKAMATTETLVKEENVSS